MKNNLEVAFDKFDAANPDIWEKFVEFTFDRIQKGYTHFSVASIIERIRWETRVTTFHRADDNYKIPNAHRAYYARKFHVEYPQYAGFFRTAQTRA